MRKLKWEWGELDTKDRNAFLYGIYLNCGYDREIKKWYSYACLGMNSSSSRAGLWFDSLEDCKADCVLLAKQLLLEYHECLARIMKSFDLEVETE